MRRNAFQGSSGQDAPDSDERYVTDNQDLDRIDYGFRGQLQRVPLFPLTSGRLRKLSKPAVILFWTICTCYANWKHGGEFWANLRSIAAKAGISKSKRARIYLIRPLDELLAFGMIARVGRASLEDRPHGHCATCYRVVISQAEADRLKDLPDAVEARRRVAAFKRTRRARAEAWKSRLKGAQCADTGLERNALTVERSALTVRMRSALTVRMRSALTPSVLLIRK